jgi:capsular polysaccharide biosynthesis protein
VNDNDPAVMLPLNRHDDPPTRLWVDDDFAAADEGPADFNAGLTSMGFIRASIRRGRRWWCLTAAIGFLVGLGMYVTAPPAYQASTSLLLTNGPEPQPGSAVTDAQSIAQSRPVAGLALKKLGLRESVGTFLGSYTAAPVTDRIMSITVNAPSSEEAVARAAVLAGAFLQYRADQLKAQQSKLFQSLKQQVNQAREHLNSINGQMHNLLLTQPPSPARQAKLTSLGVQRTDATSTLNELQTSTSGTIASTKELTASQITGSQVLNQAAGLPRSRLKHLILYPAVGLIIGLVVGLAIVVVRALTSDRLRRRDDIARALGAPVRLSTGAVHLSRWLPRRHGLAAAQKPDVQRIVTHLGRAVQASSRGTSLAVIPVDDPRVPALSLVSLAISGAQRGMRVVVADLAADAPAGGLLGVRKPGVHQVDVKDVRLVVAIPERDDVAPVGPLARIPPGVHRTPFTRGVTAASPDLLLTLATLDPSFGGEHLVTWATGAVVMVTAGRSSWTKIHSVGEMIRLARARLVSAVLVGADKTDESLGVTYTPEEDDDAGTADKNAHADAEGIFVTVDGKPGSGPSDDR